MSQPAPALDFPGAGKAPAALGAPALPRKRPAPTPGPGLLDCPAPKLVRGSGVADVQARALAQSLSTQLGAAAASCEPGSSLHTRWIQLSQLSTALCDKLGGVDNTGAEKGDLAATLYMLETILEGSAHQTLARRLCAAFDSLLQDVKERASGAPARVWVTVPDLPPGATCFRITYDGVSYRVPVRPGMRPQTSWLVDLAPAPPQPTITATRCSPGAGAAGGSAAGGLATCVQCADGSCRRHACDGCRLAKRTCDKVVPCQQCTARKQSCVRSATRPPASSLSGSGGKPATPPPPPPPPPPKPVTPPAPVDEAPPADEADPEAAAAHALQAMLQRH